MSIKDDIRQEQQKLKELSFKKRVEYILDYYKYPIIATIIGLIAVIFGIKEWRHNARPVFLDALVINSDISYDPVNYLENDYAEFANVDLETYNLSIDTSLTIDMSSTDQITIANVEKLMAMYAAGNLDVVIGTEDIIGKYGALGSHVDLEKVLKKDYLEKLWAAGFEPYYCRITEEKEDENGNEIEVKSEPYLAGIYVDSSKYLKSLGEYGTFTTQTQAGNRPVFTITIGYQNLENSILFLQMITGVN